MRLVNHRGKWAVRTEDGRRYSTGLPASPAYRDAAERKARDVLRSLEPDLETVDQIWRAYMADHGDNTIAAKRLREAWQALSPTFGHLAPRQIDRALCRKYASQRGVSDGTLRKELSALRAALRWHEPNTPAVFEMPPNPQPRDRHLTRDEVRRLIDAAKADHLKLFIRLAIHTAARKTAILSLQWRAVDFARGEIRLGHVQRGKGRATVPITDSIRPHLEDAFKKSESEEGWVIEWAGGRVKDIKKGFSAACRIAGLDDVTPHVLRHTAAVWMAEAGVSMDEIAQYLGHTNPSVTYRVYARYSPTYLRRAASALDL